jgi:hypothetical protein
MQIVNIGILAHVDAGKTSLTERLLYDTGAIDRLGSVEAGTTQTDTGDIERRRGVHADPDRAPGAARRRHTAKATPHRRGPLRPRGIRTLPHSAHPHRRRTGTCNPLMPTAAPATLCRNTDRILR